MLLHPITRCINAQKSFFQCVSAEGYVQLYPADGGFLVKDNLTGKVYCGGCFFKKFGYPFPQDQNVTECVIVEAIALANRVFSAETAEECMDTDLSPFHSSAMRFTPSPDEFDDFDIRNSSTSTSAPDYYPSASKDKHLNICEYCSKLAECNVHSYINRAYGTLCPDCLIDSYSCRLAFCSFTCAYNHVEFEHGFAFSDITEEMVYSVK